MTESQKRPLALYLHVPFCRARCLYCAFPTRPAGPTTQTGYIERLSDEILNYFKSNTGWKVETVYVGGGTPTTLGNGDIRLLLETVGSVAPDAKEITIEVNPLVDDIDKIPVLRENGVNRLSVGIQSFNDEELNIIGRLHKADESRAFIPICRQAGFDSLSVDLIYGLPEQTLESFEQTLEETFAFEPEHVSLYGLSVESDSRLGRLNQAQFKGLNLPDGDSQAEMYDLARGMLGKAGYEQYEISNFAKSGHQCLHNLAYWSGQDYIGFGPGAASFIDGVRFTRISNVDAFLAAQRDGKNTVEYLESLSTKRAAAEALVMGLRLSCGVRRDSIETRFGIKISDLCGEALVRFSNEGLVEMDDDNIRLTERAFLISNAIFRDLIG